jgi:hypothetical protein
MTINNTLLILYVLIPVNLVLYLMLAEGYLRDKRYFSIPKVAAPAEAFALFERAYRQSFPREQEGFTWEEAVKKVNQVVPVSDYLSNGVQKSLKQYEAFRYGGIGKAEQVDVAPILKLTILLRKKIYFS